MRRHLRNSQRLLAIAYTLAREDALFLLDDFGVSPTLSFFAHIFVRRQRGKTKGERLARAFERLGPTFIKLGQAISTRSDIIGDDIADDLAMLRDKLPPFPTPIARNIIEAELGLPIISLFKKFDDIPVAAASIAQVHRAMTHAGKEVAVKVLRPDIEEAFARDIDLFFWIADIVEEKLPEYRRLKVRQIVQTFKDTVFFELDLRFEAAAADELAANTVKHPTGMRIPAVYWDLTSRRTLTIDWIDGISFNDMDAIRASGFDQDMLLQKIADSLFTQIFVDGFFHADLHPGNLFLDSKTGELVAVDFGIMGRLDWESRAYIAQIVHGFLNEDYASVAKLHFQAGYVPAHKSLEAFTQACRAVARPILGKPLNEISIASLLGQMFKIAAEFEMETQPQLLLMQKTLMVAEGLGRMLNPSLNMWELARPLIEEWANSHFSKTARAKMAMEKAREVALKLPSVMKDMERTLKVLGDERGLKLHPESMHMLQHERELWHKRWLAFAWVVLAVAVAYVIIY